VDILGGLAAQSAWFGTSNMEQIVNKLLKTFSENQAKVIKLFCTVEIDTLLSIGNVLVACVCLSVCLSLCNALNF